MLLWGLIEAKRFVERYRCVFCLALEGLNGVMDPMDETVNRERKFSGQIESAKKCREILKGEATFWNHRRNARFRIP